MPSRKLRDSAATGGGSEGMGTWAGDAAGAGAARRRVASARARIPRCPAGQHPGQPRSAGLRAMVTVRGHRRGQSPASRPGALVAAAVALLGCLRGSRNMHDASSPCRATSWQCPAHIPKSALRRKERRKKMNIHDMDCRPATWKPCGRLSRARFWSRGRLAMTRRGRRGTWPWTRGPPLSWRPGRPPMWPGRSGTPAPTGSDRSARHRSRRRTARTAGRCDAAADDTHAQRQHRPGRPHRPRRGPARCGRR